MSNPRIAAEDVAKHYISRLNPYISHKSNVKKYLRKPILALTRRFLLPQKDYDQMETNQQVRNQNFGEETAVFDFSKAREGLDWRDYMETSQVGESGLDQSFVSETETETEDNSERDTMDETVNPSMKLSRRSLARMESFLASCALALPNDVTSAELNTSVKGNLHPISPKWMHSLTSKLTSVVGVSGTRKSISDSFTQLNTKDTSITTNRSSSKPRVQTKSIKYPQMHLNDLIVRIELYIRTLRRVYAVMKSSKLPNESKDECVIHLEPNRALETRIYNMIDSLISTTGNVGSMSYTLSILLTHFTREMLAVEYLSEDIQEKINTVVQEYEHQTSFASLAFLSSPEESAETHLAPLLFAYVDLLVRDHTSLVWDCRLEGTLTRALDPTLRKVFKTTEFRSIGHLLKVCDEFKESLQNIVILPKDHLLHASSKDGSSEVNILASPSFEYNLNDLCENKTAVKQSLRDLRRETIVINGHVLPPIKSLSELLTLLRERLNSRPVKLKDKKIGNISTDESIESASETDSEQEPQIYSDAPSSHLYSDSEESDIVGSGDEGDVDTSLCNDPSGEDISHSAQDSRKDAKHASRRRVHSIDAIDILTRRLLLAASRTRGGGDAYFVVRDLFGGEGLQVVQEHQNRSGPYMNGKISATIEVSLKLASVTIRCHSKFNVYPETISGDCEPLIQLHTTVTETIELQEVRICDEKRNDDQPTKVMLIEKQSDKTGLRVLSIRPASYEKIENWRTPS